MSPDERLLSTRKQIWSMQIHNIKAQLNAIRHKIGSMPNELVAPMVMIMQHVKEAEKLLNDAEYALDSEVRDALRHAPRLAGDHDLRC